MLSRPSSVESDLLELQQDAGRQQAIDTQQMYQEEALKTADLIKDIRTSIKESGGQMSKAYASRLEAIETAPLREQLAALQS